MESINVQKERKIVVKAGGSILSHRESFINTAISLKSLLSKYERIFVVVSAPNGITDMISKLLEFHDETEMSMIIKRISETIEASGCSKEQTASTIRNIITYSSLFKKTGKIYYQDLALIQGELFSSKNLESVLTEDGTDDIGIMDPSQFLYFRRNARGEWEFDGIKAEYSFKRALKFMEEFKIIIVPGFYGVNGKGKIITIGRGGSDLTASLLSILSGADKLEFWKDVNGIYSMDPRKYTTGVRIAEISMQNAALLDLLGSRILQEQSISSLMNCNDLPEIEVKSAGSSFKGTVLRSRNTFDFLLTTLDNANVRIYLKKFNQTDPLKLHSISSSHHISIGHNLFMEISKGKFKRMKSADSTILLTKFNNSIISIFIGDYLGRYSYSFFKRLKIAVVKNFPDSQIYYSQELNIIFIPGPAEFKEGILSCIRETAQEVIESWTK